MGVDGRGGRMGVVMKRPDRSLEQVANVGLAKRELCSTGD